MTNFASKLASKLTEEFAAFMPSLAQDMEANLNQEVVNIKQNPQEVSAD